MFNGDVCSSVCRFNNYSKEKYPPWCMTFEKMIISGPVPLKHLHKPKTDDQRPLSAGPTALKGCGKIKWSFQPFHMYKNNALRYRDSLCLR